MNKKFRNTVLASLLLFSGACNNPNQATNSESQEFTIKFKPMINGEEVKCGQKYKNAGKNKTDIEISDFRLYLSNLRLIDKNGKEQKLSLKQDNKWQLDNLALLDFEDKSGECSNGNLDTNMDITGTAPKGEYNAISFDLGVPFELNHQDVNTAKSPLNLSSLFWVWRSGYKFTRIDLKTNDQDYFIHLGSTECVVENEMMSTMAEENPHSGHSETDMVTMPPSTCKNPNRPEIKLENFDPDKNTVIVDLGALVADAELDNNAAESSPGCMSEQIDPDCKSIFNNFGLDFAESKSEGQKMFKVEE